MSDEPAFGIAGFSVNIHSANGVETLFFPPGSGDISVGRDGSCRISLVDGAISRRHLLIRLVGGSLIVEDTSANGTMIDGRLIRQSTQVIQPTSVLHLGGFELRFSEPGAASEAIMFDPHPTELPRRKRSSPRGPSASTVPRSDRDMRVGEGRFGAWIRQFRRPSRRPQLHLRSRQAGSRPKSVASCTEAWVDHLDLLKLERSRLNPLLLRAKVELALQQICKEQSHLLPQGTDIERLIKELCDEAVGLGPLEELLADDTVSEIMVVDPKTIYVERAGKMNLTTTVFTDEESLRSTLERIVMPLGRRIDESAPMLDARLPDGSRVNAIIPPLATRGPCITIRKFSKKPLKMQNLIEFNSINERMARFLERSVQARKNIVVAGGTGSGKTTLLNILSGSCSDEDRIVTIEDSAELRLQQSHVVTLEARPANMEGKGEVTIRDLVKNAMRMRPDRIIVGECRGGEALDMLLAMNTGHDGSMTTTHANSPAETLRRIESLALMSGVDLPNQAIREQIAYAVDLVVHQTRFSDGTRKVTSITEIAGLEDGEIETREIFGFRRRSTSALGKVEGEFYATGYLPSYLTDFIAQGIMQEGDNYL